MIFNEKKIKKTKDNDKIKYREQEIKSIIGKITNVILTSKQVQEYDDEEYKLLLQSLQEKLNHVIEILNLQKK